MTHNILSALFTWATGIEDTFIAHARPGLRALDEYELTQHYKLWKNDIDLVAETGVQAVRWGIPWHKVQPAADRWDWEWTDHVLDYLVNTKKITPILDLMHYGTPPWLENSFVNSSYPQRVAEYAGAVVARYKSLIQYYTPLNEPMVNAEFCGYKAEWPPYLSGEDGYVKLTLALARGIVLTTRAIKDEQSDAITVQVEALWHTFTKDESLHSLVAQANARQYLCFDLTTGRVDDRHELADFIRSHGATEAELDWLRENCVRFDILGANYYPWSYTERKRHSDGRMETVSQNPSGHTIEIILRDAWDRYHMPIMVTETSSKGDIPTRQTWMDETLDTVASLRQEGIPVIGYTWFPLFTMVDWAYRKGRQPLEKYLLHLGLYDSSFDTEGVLQRKETPLVKHYVEHTAHSMPQVSGVSQTSAALRSRVSLDGQWLFSTTGVPIPKDATRIAVPSPWQADDRFREHEGEAWYQREFVIPQEWLTEERVIQLGFGAVDYFAEVWLNDVRLGMHEGGYLPFEFDITTAARPGENTLTVRVDDPLEMFPEIPHGKQSWYGLLSGIWQSVWVESRAANHIQRVKILTDGEQVTVEVIGRGDFAEGLTAQILNPEGQIVAQSKVDAPRFSLRVERPQLWSPDQANLYTLKVTTPVDKLTETFGFRSIETRDGRILLNGRPFYLRGALDQDYYPELICTPPSMEFIEDQFRKAKEMGLNCLRIHIKAGDPRYYEAADRIGLLIWTELPNHDLLTEDAKRRARETLMGMVERDGNHPSIGIWTIINESWGIDLTDPAQRAWLSETYYWLKELDPTRIVVGNSACWGNFQVVTDIADFHNYYAMPDHYVQWQKWTDQYASRPWWLFAHEYANHAAWREFLRDPWHGRARTSAADVLERGDEPLLVSEFGNWGLPDVRKLYEGNGGAAPWWFDTGLEWSDGIVYPRGIEQRFQQFHMDRVFSSLAALTEASQKLQYEALKFQIENMRAHDSIQGYVITEFTDVHWESNGLLDMYRNPKFHYPLLSSFNGDDVLIPNWERLTYFAGEPCEMNVLFSHYSDVEIKDAMLVWDVSGDGFTTNYGQVQIGACASFGVMEPGSVKFEVPQVSYPTAAQISLKLYRHGHLVASNQQEIFIFPEISPDQGEVIYSRDLREPLETLGYSITDDLSQAKLAVVTVLDDFYRDFILRGGKVLLLAETDDAFQMHSPHVAIERRAGTAWQGDWASSFGWHRFKNIPTGGVINFAFAGLTPEHIISRFMPGDFAFNVYAGLFVGWLHKPVPTIARRRIGQGEILVSTFRLSEHLDNNPLAQYLLVELIKLVRASETSWKVS